MKTFPLALLRKLENRSLNNALRKLPDTLSGIDFCSNDYLGFAKNKAIFDAAHLCLEQNQVFSNGATGSRLLTGNHFLYEIVEQKIAAFHHSESALIFNSGYAANIGFFSAVPQRHDIILFDELSHASIREGIQLSKAKSYKFRHNDYEHLSELLNQFRSKASEVYIVTESVFSMDGDAPNLEVIASITEEYDALLVVDEAHALGVLGENGVGLVSELQLNTKVFAQIVTFGKALGCHGAAILGSVQLKAYLVNFASSFIYTTGLPPHSIATIIQGYSFLEKENVSISHLRNNIRHFNQEKNRLGLKPIFVKSQSAIQCAIIPMNETVKSISKELHQNGFEVKAILAPTVPLGQERLRFCLHSYNTNSEITIVLEHLSKSLFGS